MKENYYKTCSNCESTKQAHLFASNGWCKVCMSNYLKQYKTPRLDFEATLLTEEDMKNEMRSIRKVNPKGLNALGDLTEQFETALKIKSYRVVERVRNPKPFTSKTFHTAQTFLNKLNY